MGAGSKTPDTLRSWYPCITATRLLSPFPGAEKIRGDFAVAAQLQDLGLAAHAPRKIEFKRQGKRRYADAIQNAYLPGYVFAQIPAHRFQEAIAVKGMGRNLMMIQPREVRDHVLPFIDAASAEEAEALRIMARNDHAEMCGFKAGQALEIISGPFMERAVEFRRMVRNAEGWAEIEAEASLLGQNVRVRIDPLDVRKVG